MGNLEQTHAVHRHLGGAGTHIPGTTQVRAGKHIPGTTRVVGKQGDKTFALVSWSYLTSSQTSFMGPVPMVTKEASSNIYKFSSVS